MQVIRLHGAHDLRVHSEPLPFVSAEESLVRVTAVGVCGSDLHWFADAGIGAARLEQPLVLGHEFAGVIEETGQRVAVDPLIQCEHCEFCLAGKPNLCLDQRFAGHATQDGALREYIAWRAHDLYPLPDELSDEDGAMLEPLGVAIHSINLAGVERGMTIGVLGCGPIGLLIIQVARVAGAARVLATDQLLHRLDAARAFGSEIFLADNAESNALLAATKGRGVDVVFECAGNNAAVETAVAAVKPGGKVILIGIPEDDRTLFTASIARRKEIVFQMVRRMRHTYPRAIDLVQRRLVDVRSLVTHRFSLAEASQAFSTAARRDGIKVMIRG